MGALLRAAGNVAILLAAVTISLAALEVAARLLPIDPRLRAGKIALPANTSLTLHNVDPRLDPEVVVHRNDVGLRGPARSDRRPDALAILTVGGSTTESIKFNHETSWPGLLDRGLRRHFADVWLNNAGINGQTTFGHLVLLTDHLLGLDPQVVLFLIGVNDVGHDAPESPRRADEGRGTFV